MKRISVREISEIMSKKEMMRLLGGDDTGCGCGCGCGCGTESGSGSGYIGTGSGSPCYSSDGSCYGTCAFIDTVGHAHHGTCTPDESTKICACVAED